MHPEILKKLNGASRLVAMLMLWAFQLILNLYIKPYITKVPPSEVTLILRKPWVYTTETSRCLEIVVHRQFISSLFCGFRVCSGRFGHSCVMLGQGLGRYPSSTPMDQVWQVHGAFHLSVSWHPNDTRWSSFVYMVWNFLLLGIGWWLEVLSRIGAADTLIGGCTAHPDCPCRNQTELHEQCSLPPSLFLANVSIFLFLNQQSTCY